MAARIPENVPTWLVDCGPLGNTVPSRDPKDDENGEDGEDDDGDAEPDDDLDPAVVREPDE
jgi:hypothetical protein